MSNENKNELPVKSLTNYFYFVFIHLQGVNAPKNLFLSDFAINNVSPCSEHNYLKAVLWKLWSLALNNNREDTKDNLDCENIDPNFFIYYLGKADEKFLKICSTSIYFFKFFHIDPYLTNNY